MFIESVLDSVKKCASYHIPVAHNFNGVFACALVCKTFYFS